MKMAVSPGIMLVALGIALCLYCGNCHGQTRMLAGGMYHLRNAEPREWEEFPCTAYDRNLRVSFTARRNPADQTLYLRQYDVKQEWAVAINGMPIGALTADEKDMLVYFDVPEGTLRDGENILEISSTVVVPDDIRVGAIGLDDRSREAVLSEAQIEVTIAETVTGKLMPGRITIVNRDRVLQTVKASSGALAARPGYVYTGNGRASVTLPAGSYTIFAGRGFEYGIDSAAVELKPGEHLERTLRIAREVPTEGWVSCDTHIHTLTHSGHGDATLEERAITVAGEGIELPVLTDHNINAGLRSAAEAQGVAQYFTPVTGNELTTKVGHFNIFPAVPGTPAVDHHAEDWNGVADNLAGTQRPRIVILNHARDIHNGFRPFDPAHHLSAAGMNTRDRTFPANAMEVINSGSQQTDIATLYGDWFGMLNRGYFLTPVGSSDSHDVSRYTVGQGRTYIRSIDDDPSGIDVDAAVGNFLEGKVMVSLGLLTRIMVNGLYGPGEIVPASGRINVSVEVLGPAWAKARRVALFLNGRQIREEEIRDPGAAGVKGRISWEIPVPEHDVFLVAIAEGPGGGMPYWPLAKPYQPASPDWQPKLMGSTGAVWVDGDGNGKADSAFGYASELVEASRDRIGRLFKKLARYDEAVAVQAAIMLWDDGVSIGSPAFGQYIQGAAPNVKAGFETAIAEVQKLKPR